MVYRLHTSDRTAFKRCRREWDFSSRNRQNLEPTAHPESIDFARALRDALAVYYFPGMWEWDRAIVQPLVHQALDRSVRGQAEHAADDETPQELLERGHALLDAYAAWAPTVDHFTPIRVDTDFEVNVPDPARPGVNLLTAAGDEVKFYGRVDLLVIDSDDAYWVVQHRLVSDGWADHDALQLDEQTIMWAWAWPLFYMGMQISGTVYNEVRADAGKLGAPVPVPEGRPPVGHRRMYARARTVSGERLHAEGTDSFRRTRIRRSAAELASAGADLAAEVNAATSPDLQIYPSPGLEVCSRCLYRSPCLIVNQGQDPSAELLKSYRSRPAEDIQEGRLGGVTWSINRGAAPPPWARKG
jgi:hypothetical protein